MSSRVLLTGLALTLCAAAPVAAQAHPVQLALFTPVQIVPEHDAVGIIRLNLIYSANQAVRYVDVGLINVTTGGPSEGVQWALVAINQGSFTGWQHSPVAVTRGPFIGFQQGYVFTNATNGEGVQLAVVNTAQSWHGLQIGLVNYTQNLHGLQIGLINIIKVGGAMPVLPIVNWSF
jgi:hypothetical protein